MDITYKTDYHSNLYMYIEVDSAADYKKIDDKLYTHSEYETEWHCKLAEWYEKGYAKDCLIDVLEGRTKVMIILQFVGARFKAKEFIPELEKHFNHEYRSLDVTSVYYTELKSIESL